MKLFFATGNQGKVKELENLVKDLSLDIEILYMKDYPDFVSPPETGTTFKENALIKSRSACEYTGLPSLADDSGLVVPALAGAPGVYSARYSGENATSESNNEKLLKEMENIPDEQRNAYFCAVLCLSLPDGNDYFSEGRVNGKILRNYVGNNGFGYDPLFFVPEMGKGMAEMTMEEKNSISHRSRAFNGLCNALNSCYSEKA
ncbi:MAG: XTP/dITP diphosphatase [Firmicutes bacterium]|nr:XTP/dITP diphosphatase [Bacillota bacterium]